MTEPPNSIFDILQALIGIKFSTLIAGLLGTITKLFLTGGNWKETFIAVFIGLVSVLYFVHPLVVSNWNVMNIPEGTMGYLVGMTAMSICTGIIRTAKMWSQNPSVPRP